MAAASLTLHSPMSASSVGYQQQQRNRGPGGSRRVCGCHFSSSHFTTTQQPLVARQQPWGVGQQQQQQLGLNVPTRQLVLHVAAAAGQQQQAATMPQSGGNMQGQVDPDYLSAAAYLAEVGFANKTEIARVLDIAMNPNSLFVQASVNVNARPLAVDADMKPVVEFMQDKGVAKADIVRVISAHPPVLSYSVEGRLVPFWDYLTSIGVTDVAAAVAKRPSILGLSVDTSLRKIVEYLQYIETPADKIVDYICNTI